MDDRTAWDWTIPACVLLGILAFWAPSAFAVDEPTSPESAPGIDEGQADQGKRRGEGPGEANDIGPNCRAEVKKLCGGVEPGSGRIRQCIQDNEGKLSPACRQKIQEKVSRMKEGFHELRAACEGDVKRLCPNVEPGGGRIAGCLKEHRKEVSEGCARAMEQRHKKR